MAIVIPHRELPYPSASGALQQAVRAGAMVLRDRTQGTPLRSLDGGVSWAPIAIPTAGAAAIRGIGYFGSRLVLSTFSSPRFFWSEDDGVSWTASDSPAPSGVFGTIPIAFGGRMVAITDPGGVMVSEDGGKVWGNWTPVPELSPASPFAPGLTTSADGSFLVVPYVADAVSVSYDGTSWVVVPEPAYFVAPDYRTGGVVALCVADGVRYVATSVDGFDWAHHPLPPEISAPHEDGYFAPELIAHLNETYIVSGERDAPWEIKNFYISGDLSSWVPAEVSIGPFELDGSNFVYGDELFVFSATEPYLMALDVAPPAGPTAFWSNHRNSFEAL